MAPISIKYVVSFSSQDSRYPVAGLLSKDAKKWLSDPHDKSGQVEVVLQLEKACCLDFIDLGVIWAASTEIRVGRSDWPQSQSLVTLVPTQMLMTPLDSRLGRATSRTCMFSRAHFNALAADEIWDRVYVVCRQPWRKDVQIGLSFIRIRSSDAINSTTITNARDFNSSTPGKKTPNVKDIQRHFFGDVINREKPEDESLKLRLQKLVASGEGNFDNKGALSRIAHMVLAANQSTMPALSEPKLHSKDSALYSNVAQRNTLSMQQQIQEFLSTLQPHELDLDKVKISDLRHKFEKIKWRKLTREEKQTFYSCCTDVLGRIYDSSTASTLKKGNFHPPGANIASSPSELSRVSPSCSFTAEGTTISPLLSRVMLSGRSLVNHGVPKTTVPSGQTNSRKFGAESANNTDFLSPHTDDFTHIFNNQNSLPSVGKKTVKRKLEIADTIPWNGRTVADDRKRLQGRVSVPEMNRTASVNLEAKQSGMRIISSVPQGKSSDTPQYLKTVEGLIDSQQIGKEALDTGQKYEPWLTTRRDGGCKSRANCGAKTHKSLAARFLSGRVGASVQSQLREFEDVSMFGIQTMASMPCIGTRGRRQRQQRVGGKKGAQATVGPNPIQYSGQHCSPPASDSYDLSGELLIDESAVFVECPLCCDRFPSDTITVHAALCCT